MEDKELQKLMGTVPETGGSRIDRALIGLYLINDDPTVRDRVADALFRNATQKAVDKLLNDIRDLNS